MKSPRGLMAAIAFLLALPLALMWERLFGKGGGPVIHFSLALGSGLLSSAIADFPAPVWARWLGRLSTGLLALIFVLQGTSELAQSRFLSELAFHGLGQQLEGWLGTAFLLWCMIAVLMDRPGGRKVLGLVVVALAAALRVYATVFPSGAASLETAAPLLKLLYLLPFVWLLVESGKSSPGDSAAIEALGPTAHGR
jgi:hypothetical protein